MSAVEMDHIKLSGHKIECSTCRLFYMNRLCATVCNLYSPCDDIKLCKYTVEQCHTHTTRRILQIYF